MYVQYGCGMSAPKEWINFDASPNLRLEKLSVIGRLYSGKKATNDGYIIERFPENVSYGDIVKGLPISKSSCSGIYASHVLEHLSLNDFRVAIKNTFDILSTNGIFRFVVPDLEILARNYLKSETPLAAIKFIEETGMGTKVRSKDIKSILNTVFGNGQHLWMWDFKSLKYELEIIGFIKIRRANFNDSSNSMFYFVEDELRFINSVCIECYKP